MAVSDESHASHSSNPADAAPACSPGMAEIPDARLLLLEGAGHGVDQADWETIVTAILEHTDPTV